MIFSLSFSIVKFAAFAATFADPVAAMEFFDSQKQPATPAILMRLHGLKKNQWL
jgi:hypothetical protein